MYLCVHFKEITEYLYFQHVAHHLFSPPYTHFLFLSLPHPFTQCYITSSPSHCHHYSALQIQTETRVSPHYFTNASSPEMLLIKTRKPEPQNEQDKDINTESCCLSTLINILEKCINYGQENVKKISSCACVYKQTKVYFEWLTR